MALEIFKGFKEFVDAFGGVVVAEGETDERGVVTDVVEVIVDAEVAGAGHNSLAGKGGAEEVAIKTIDIK